MLEMLRAHGLQAGPAQRPVLAGLVAGLVANIPAAAAMHALGTYEAFTNATGLGSVWLQVVASAAAGAGYALLFQRAANHLAGAWLFAMAYAYLVWQAVAVPLLQWIPPQPLLVGRPAQGLFLGHLAWGLAAGLVFPFVHRWVLARIGGRRVVELEKGFGRGR